MKKVTDPALLEALNSGPKKVTDPALLAELNFRPVSRSLEEARAAQLSGAVEEQPAELPPLVPKVSQPNAYGLGAADIGGMGFADELAAPIGALISGDPQEQVLEMMRAQAEGAQEQHPNSFLTGQVGGGVAQAAAGGLPAILRGGSSLLGKTLAGMGIGGTAGATHGAGTGTDAQSRVVNALVEGGIGATTGGILPVVGTGAANLYSAGRDALVKSGMPAPMEIMRLLAQAIPDAGVAKQNIAAAGPDAMLADAGPNARAILDESIQHGGAAGEATRRAIEARASRAGETVNTALDSAMGAPQGVEATRTAIREGTATARDTAYKAAYSAPIDYASPDGQVIESIVKTRVPKSAIDAANELMRTEGAQSKQILAQVADDGTVTFETLPDVKQLDYITRGLNEVADKAHGEGKLGGTTARGRAYESLSKEIRNKLKAVVPEYGTALETAADPIRRSKAVKFGSTVLSPSTTRDDVAEFADGITGPERKAALQGIRSHIDDTIANVTRTLQDPNTDAREAIKALKDLSSRAARAKIATIIDDPQVVDDLFKQLDQASSAFDLRAATTENSKTHVRKVINKRISDMSEPGPIGTALEGSPFPATKKIIQALTGRTPERRMAMDDATHSKLSELLTRQATPDLIGSLEKMGTRDEGTRLMQERIIRALTGGVGPSGQLTGSRGRERLGM